MAAIITITIVVSAFVSYLYFAQPLQTVTLTGEGATFPAPLLNQIITSYHNTKNNIQITYNPTGSSNGIKSLAAKSVDFACSDAPLSTSDSAKAPNVLHIPETVGAVTVAYNLGGISTGLNLTGKVIADIFSGKITKWNDPSIQDLNTVTMPDNNITVVHRSDGSGTTFIFTKYLSSTSQAWTSHIGSGKTVEWPVGLGASGNTGVASVVQANPYAIGYIELAYILENNMTVAAVQNPSGKCVIPSLSSTETAAQSAASTGLPKGNEVWSDVSLLNAAGNEAYPIVSFSYTMVYKELNVVLGMTSDRADALVKFLWWMVHDGQGLASGLSYAQLPVNVVQANEVSIRSITFNGQTVFR
jgi:phosphate ABC transporter phosphate-binding protein